MNYLKILFILFFYLFYLFHISHNFKISNHPIENRIKFIYDLNLPIQNNHNNNFNYYQNNEINNQLINLFKNTPCLIFRNSNFNNKIFTPKNFVDFVNIFEKQRFQILNNNKNEFIKTIDYNNIYQQLQQKITYNNNYNHCKKQDIFHWNVEAIDKIIDFNLDFYKKITSYYIIKKPLYFDDFNLISSETIFENLPNNIKNLLFKTKIIYHNNNNEHLNVTNNFNNPYNHNLININKNNHKIKKYPVIYEPENPYENYKVLFSPSKIKYISDYDEKQTKYYIDLFMKFYVLPHRINIQLKEKDIIIFNNRLFFTAWSPFFSLFDENNTFYKDNQFFLYKF